MTRRTGTFLLLSLSLVVIAAVGGQTLLRDPGVTVSDETPAPRRWPDGLPLHGRPLPAMRMTALPEPGIFATPDQADATPSWVDISRVQVAGKQWSVELAGRPPAAAGLNPAHTLISYGLVFDSSGDGMADHVVGINNDAPRAGDFRVWLTELASGSTEEQIGPPYGLPVEFAHPDEHRAPPDEEPQPPAVTFTFLSGRPRGLTTRSPFYAWAVATDGGVVAAWDLAPDAAWLKAEVAP